MAHGATATHMCARIDTHTHACHMPVGNDDPLSPFFQKSNVCDRFEAWTLSLSFFYFYFYFFFFYTRLYIITPNALGYPDARIAMKHVEHHARPCPLLTSSPFSTGYGRPAGRSFTRSSHSGPAPPRHANGLQETVHFDTL